MGVVAWPGALSTNSTGAPLGTVSGPHWPSAPKVLRSKALPARAPVAGAGAYTSTFAPPRGRVVAEVAGFGVGRVHAQAGDLAVEHHLLFSRNGGDLWCLAGDEAVGCFKRSGGVRRLAVVDARNHHVGGALEFGACGGHVGGLAFLAYPQTVGLGELVVVVRADRHPFHGAAHLVARRVLGSIQRFEERARARELVAFSEPRYRPHAVVGRAAEDRVAHRLIAAAVVDVVADGVAAARVAHQYHLACTRGLEHLVHFGLEVGHVLCGRG